LYLHTGMGLDNLRDLHARGPTARQLIGDIVEAAVLSVVLGALVAGLYRILAGELTWSFIGGDIVGIVLGFSLLVSTAPRRRS
jgi:hypothetical protein